MRTVGAGRDVALARERALAVWTDHDRWHAFVEGFAHVVELDPAWPSPGARIVWESGPEGRGRVTERVLEHKPERRLVTEFAEEPLGGGPQRLSGRQTVEFERPDRGAWAAAGASSEGGHDATAELVAAHAELWLDYELRHGPGRRTDLLFVRRAIHDALARTLERFAAEAAGEAAR
jgi:hypothetical protein